MNNSTRLIGQEQWVPLSFSLSFLFRQKRLILWSSLLFLATILLTWVGYRLSIDWIDGLTGGFFVHSPDGQTLFGWIKLQGWRIMKLLFFLVARIAAFYLSFLLAYIMTSPGYIFLSGAVEKHYLGAAFEADPPLTVRGIVVDLLEGVKIGLFGVLVTILALMVNFIPVVGQVSIFVLYAYYSALMFLDYPASRRRWSLGQKVRWMSANHKSAFRLGILPALTGMIPILNIFFMAALFPIMTVHTTLNFIILEKSAQGK